MLIESILSEVKKDIASFADPGAAVDIGQTGEVTWIRSRQTHTAQLIQQDGFPAVRYQDREYDYSAFLSSEALADLRDLAEWTISQLNSPDVFLAGPATQQVGRTAEETRLNALDLILKRTVKIKDLPISATRVLFVHGQAGAGKTAALINATTTQAQRYLEGQEKTLLLYLDA